MQCYCTEGYVSGGPCIGYLWKDTEETGFNHFAEGTEGRGQGCIKA